MFDLALFDKALEMMFRMAGVAILANHDVELLASELPWKRHLDVEENSVHAFGFLMRLQITCWRCLPLALRLT